MAGNEHLAIAADATALESAVIADPADSIAARLIIAVNFWRRAGNATYQAAFGLSITEVHVLRLLAARAPQSLTAIAAQCGLDKTQMSRAVKRLVARGLVRHNKSSRNGEERGLSLGPEGLRLGPALAQASDERQRVLLDGLSGDEIAALDRTLDRLLANARASSLKPD